MRLFILYVAVWIMPLSSATWYESGYNVGLSGIAKFYMFSLIAIMFYFSFIALFIFRKIPSKEIVKSRFNEIKSINFQVQCIKLWFCIFILEVIFSGGAPIIWDSQRNYGDFGIPTVHGFSNLLRAMIISHLVLFKQLNFKMSRTIVLFSILPLFGALIVEQSRGAFVMTGCFALAPWLLFLRLSLKKILIVLISAPLLVVTLSIFQFIRYADSAVEESTMIWTLVSEEEAAYEKLVEPVFNYIATPALNAGLTIDKTPMFKFHPYESIKGLVPTPLRPLFWNMDPHTKDDFGELVNEAFNTSTFISPFVRDFGIVGSLIFFSGFFFMSIYVYHKARCGSVVNIVRLPPLVMCIALSFFTTYLTSLVTILYLVLSGPISRRLMS